MVQKMKTKPTPLLVKEINLLIKKKKLVLFCGAGVSVAPPANLPPAKTLVKNVLSEIFGNKFMCYKFQDLRPEVIFESIHNHNPILLERTLNAQLNKGFPNANHRFASYLFLKNISTITSNFDTLIERSIPNFIKAVSINSFCATSPIIYKIHGDIINFKTLIATMQQVGQGLPLWKIRLLRKMCKSKTILVLGYSGLDQIDIMPALSESQYNKIIWINHKQGSGLIQRHTPSKTPEVQNLQRIKHLTMDTSQISYHLKKTRCSISPKRPHRSFESINQDMAEGIAIDLLIKANDYYSIIQILGALPPRSASLKKQISWCIAKSSISQDSIEIKTFKDEIISKISTNLKANILTGIDFYIRQISTNDGLNEIKKLLPIKQDNTKYSIEISSAAIEIAYKLSLEARMDESDYVVRLILDLSYKNGDILLRGRSLIILSSNDWYRYQESGNYKFIISGINYIEMARFYFGKEILNDKFFYHQAQNNLAMMIKEKALYIQQLSQEKSKELLNEARVMYQENLEYYKKTNTKYAIHTIYNISELHKSTGNNDKRISWINKGMSMIEEEGDNYMLHYYLRAKGDALWHDGRQSEGLSLLEKATDMFSQSGNNYERDQTIKMFNELKNNTPI